MERNLAPEMKMRARSEIDEMKCCWSAAKRLRSFLQEWNDPKQEREQPQTLYT
jgi:hypothetical protein